MLGTIFAKLYGFILEIIMIRWAELKGVRARGQESFSEGRSTMHHILTLHTLIKHKYLKVNVSIPILLI